MAELAQAQIRNHRAPQRTDGAASLGRRWSPTGRKCRCPWPRPPRITRRWCWIGAGFAATPSWPSSGCRPMCCTNSRRNVPSPPTCARCEHRFDHFDLADAIDFVSIESTSAIKPKSADLACEIDMLRSLKKTDIRTPDGDSGFWVMEQKAGNVTWQEVNSLVRPGVSAHVHLPVDLPRRDGGVVLPLAATAHRFGEIPRRGPAASSAQGRPHLQGNRADRRGIETARARR